MIAKAVAPITALIRHRFESELLPRYRALQEREQRLVTAAAVVIPLLLLIFALILPLNDRAVELRGEHQRLQQQVAEAEALAEQLKQAGQQGGHDLRKGSVISRVEQLARSLQLRQYMTRIRPQPQPAGGSQRLLLQMKDAPYSACVKLIDAMARSGLELVSIRFQAGQQPGHVHLQMVIGG